MRATPIPNVELIAAALRQHLPPERAADAETIARAIAAPDAASRLDDPQLRELLLPLVGQLIQIDNRGGSIQVGNISDSQQVAVGPGAVAIGDVQITILPPADRSPRLLPWLLGALCVVTLIPLLVSVGPLVMARVRPAPYIPQSTDLIPVPSEGMAIQALALAKGELFVAGRDTRQVRLYRATGAAPQSRLEYVRDLPADVLEMQSDCHGNLWVAMQDVGTLVHPAGGSGEALLISRATTAGKLPFSTAQALAIDCSDPSVTTVWLGYQGVVQIQYTGTYPALSAWTIAPADPIIADRPFNQVQSIHYSYAMRTLFVGDVDGRLARISEVGGTQITPDLGPVWSIREAPDGSVWAGSGLKLVHIVGEQVEMLGLQDPAGGSLTSQAYALAATAGGMWVGSPCVAAAQHCWPLAVVVDGQLRQVRIDARYAVHALLVDASGAIWIGTNQGLLVYPSERKR